MSTSDGYILIALIVLPLAAAVLLMLTPSRERCFCWSWDGTRDSLV